MNALDSIWKSPIKEVQRVLTKAKIALSGDETLDRIHLAQEYARVNKYLSKDDIELVKLKNFEVLMKSANNYNAYVRAKKQLIIVKSASLHLNDMNLNYLIEQYTRPLSLIEEFCIAFSCSELDAVAIFTNYLYRNTKFEGVVKDNIFYSELENQWQSDYDAKYIKSLGYQVDQTSGSCNDEEEHDYQERTDIKVTSENFVVKLEQNGEYNFINDTYASIDIVVNRNHILQFMKDNLNFGRVFCDKTIKLINPRGINYDHRGSDHIIVPLPFAAETVLKSCNLEEYIQRLYLLKSHKFDNNYEMYFNCNTSYSGKSIVVVVDFDHGS